MKIGIDCRCLEGNITGVGVYLSNLLQNILKLSDQSIRFVCYFEKKIPPFSWLEDARIEKKILSFKTKNNFLWSTFILPICMAKDNPDIFHAPSYTTPFIKTKKTILTIHDICYAAKPEWYSYKSDFFRRYYYYKSARNADIILTVSEFSKNEIIKHYRIDSKKIKVIYHGVNEKYFQNIDKNNIVSILKKQNIEGDYILYVGNIHPRRNLECLINAFIKLKNEHDCFDRLRFVIAGKDEGLLHKLLSLYGKRKDVIFTGYVREEYIQPLYNGAKCFVYPALYEGFGFPILESMACGTPTIISDIPVFREIFKDNSLFTDPYNINEIKKNIYKILTNEKLQKDLSGKGRSCASLFTWKDAAAKTLKIYESLLQKY
ncbi:MAG: glycosyltransferase family 4 protein [Candidatus Kuenenia sp.]|nr:glycosyltransferase family 4 protein [Candidatus Kuenenia hertensis]